MKVYLSSLSLLSKTLHRYLTTLPSPKPSQYKNGPNNNNLYRRLTPFGDPSVSVVPLLDQWVSEGKPVNRTQLQSIIKELTVYKRFVHALQISQWMSDKRYIPLQISDIACRLNLIHRVNGLEQAESYFFSIPQQLRGFEVYTSLLSCYARENSVEKAESIMQHLRENGFANTPISYNLLMNVYYRVGSLEKIDALMKEMEEKKIPHDKYTLSIRLSAYVSASDIEGVDKIMTIMENHKQIELCSDVYSVAAEGYFKLGHVEKAKTMLKKLEKLAATGKRPAMGFQNLLRLYAKAGDKDELYRFWNLYKEKSKIYNKGYMCMMSSLLEYNDIEGAERIFDEWESAGLSYDFWVPNILIEVYCKHGSLDKATTIIYKGMSKGGNPTVQTWYYLANGYLEKDEVLKAVEMLVKAITAETHRIDKKNLKEKLMTTLEYLEGKGDMYQVEEFLLSLKSEGLFSGSVQEKLIKVIKDVTMTKTSFICSEAQTDRDFQAVKHKSL